ncbi:hypothetical protein XELAEV_18002001mg [Xenopus laevis]|nr:hypothetical protein XELAEV_18002001mg [Xenopus laevis]
MCLLKKETPSKPLCAVKRLVSQGGGQSTGRSVLDQQDNTKEKGKRKGRRGKGKENAETSVVNPILHITYNVSREKSSTVTLHIW